MKAVLLRTGSLPIHSSLAGSPRVSLSAYDSFRDVLCGKKKTANWPWMSLHFEFSRRNESPVSIRRALSESNVIRLESEVPDSDTFTRFSGEGSRSFPALEEDLSESDEGVECTGSLCLSERGIDRSNYAGRRPERGTAVEDLGYDGGDGDDNGIRTFTGGSADRSKIRAYYQEMLKSDPTNSLLLCNYGKFLHEVEKDAVGAELYYARAILANPGDGEVLSRYGKLIWETQRDEERAKSYLDRAVQASPNDCMVLGSYAHFMWEAEEEEEEDKNIEITSEVPQALVAAF